MVPIPRWSVIPVDRDPSDFMFQQMRFEQTVILTCYFMPTSDWLGIGTYSTSSLAVQKAKISDTLSLKSSATTILQLHLTELE